jgi:hypothetical protein
MIDSRKNSQNRIKDLAFRIAKATAKAIIVYLLYFFVAPFLMPLLTFVPGLVGAIELFVTVYIVLMILGDLTEGIVFHSFFSVAKALFIIGYLVLTIGDGMLRVTADNFSLTVNFTLFYAIAALLGLLGLAKSVLQAINFMSQRAESGLKP